LLRISGEWTSSIGQSRYCFFFCLDAKETKNQGKPDRSAHFSGPTRGKSLYFISVFVGSAYLLYRVWQDVFIVVAVCIKKFSHQYFRLCVFGFDRRHVFTWYFFILDIWRI